MMKRTVALLLTTLYTITALGFVVNAHYCCKRLVSISVNTPVKSCGMAYARDSKCCKNSHFEIKVKDAHQGQSTSFLSAPFTFETPLRPSGDFLCFKSHTKNINFDSHDPPGQACPGYLKNCVFRI